MKKITILICTIFILMNGVNSQTVQNGNFENWQSVNYFYYPNSWFIIDEAGYTNAMVEKSTDAQLGTYSIKLNTVSSSADTLFAVSIYGNADDNGFKGMPYNQLGDFFHFSYKSNILTNDMGMMIMMLYKNGVRLDSIVYPFLGTHSSWTQVMLPVNPSQVQPDSMFLAFLSSRPKDFGGNPLPGSWLMIDNAYFTLGANPTPIPAPNYSFEDWTTASGDEPLPWVSQNSNYILAVNDTATVIKTTDAYNGTYAVRLSTIEIAGNKKQGKLNLSQVFVYQPEQISFDYKFFPSGTDSAFIHFEFLKNNNFIGGASYKFDALQSTYNEVLLNLYFSEVPDSVKIKMNSGENSGTVLIIDDIKFSCTKPKFLMGTFATASSAQTSWTAGAGELQWQLEWGLQGFNHSNGTKIIVDNQPQYLINGISDANNYDFYVRSICGVGDTSVWSGPFTICKSTSTPITLDFESTLPGDIPGCWHRVATSPGKVEVNNGGMSHNGTAYLDMVLNNNITSIFSSPEIDGDFSEFYVSIYARKASWASHATIMLGTMSNPSDPNTFTELTTYVLTDNYTNYIYYLNGYTGSDKHIAFRLNTNDNNTEAFLDDIIIDVAPTCIPPANLMTAGITTSSVQVSWQAGGSETMWNLIYGPAGFNPSQQGTAQNGLTSMTYNITSLNSGTTYDVYVQSDCGSGDISTWQKITFSTLCLNFVAPFEEHFESTSDAEIPNCWDRINTSGSTVEVVSWSQSTSGTNSLRMTWLNNFCRTMIVTPQITNPLNELYISFDAKSFGPNTTLITVGTMSNPNDENSFTPITNFNLNQSFENYEYYFNNYAGNDNFIALKLSSNLESFTEAYIDDIIVDTLPNCIPPNSLVVQNITATSAVLNWTAGNNETLWNLKYGPLGFDPNTQGTAINGLTSHTYNFNNTLSTGTSYDAYIQADCGNGDLSSRIKISFTTLCTSFSVPLSQNFEITLPSYIPNCWYKYLSGFAQIETVNWGQSTSGSNSLRMQMSVPDTAIMISPVLVQDINDLYISFNAKKQSWINQASLIVGTMTNPANGTTFTPLIQYNISDNFENFEYLFNTYFGTDAYIAIKLFTTAGSAEVFVDDMLIDIAPSCPKPHNLYAANYTVSTADLGWAPVGVESLWNVEVGLPGFTPGTGNSVANFNGATINTWTSTGLLPATAYQFYVQADCGGGDVSLWAGPFNFNTVCGLFSNPFSENFDATPVYNMPNCWSVVNTLNASGFVGVSNLMPLSNPNSLELSNGNIPDLNGQLLAITPELNNLNQHQIRFFAKTTVAGTILNVVTVDNPANPSVTYIQTIDLTPNYTEYLVPLGSYTGSNDYIAFEHGNATMGDQKSLYIDNFSYEVLESCPKPLNLTSENLSLDSVELGWSEAGTATKWQIEWGNQNFSLGSGNSAYVYTTSYIVNSVTPNTYYDFYVRSVCGPGDTSNWSGPYSFIRPFQCVPHTIYGQTPDPIQNFLWSSQEFNYKVFQSFYNINSIFDGLHIWGMEAFNNGGNVSECFKDSFLLEVGFYEDSNGLIGAYDTSFIVSVFPDSTYSTQGGFQIYDFNIQLPLIMQLNNGWFSVRSVNSPTCFTLFANTTNPMAQGRVLRVHNTDTIPYSPLGFCLLNNTHTVNYSAGAGGHITGQQSQLVSNGGTTTPVFAVAENCYEFLHWNDGRTDNPRVDVNVLKDTAVAAVFGLINIVGNDSLNICNGDTLFYGNQIFTQQGHFTVHFQTSLGCDSVVSLTVNVNPTFEITEKDTICNGETFNWHGHSYSVSGIYYDSLMTIYGCDSVYILNLVVHPIYEFVTTASLCDNASYNWRGNDYTLPDTYYDSLQTSLGCDSVYVLHLLGSLLYEFQHDETICSNDSVLWRGVYYSAQGTYYDSLTSQYNCDSVYVLNLFVNPTYEYVQFDTICDGDTLLWRGYDYTTGGIYYDSLQTNLGCDSVYVLNLFAYPVYEIELTASLCDNSFYNWRGNNYSIPGDYYDSLQTIYGCDSVYVLHLLGSLMYEFQHDETICSNDSVLWRGGYYSVQGTYYDSLTSQYNCDSVYVLNLFVNPAYEYLQHDTICEGNVYTWRGNDYTTGGIYYDSLQTVLGCDSVFILQLFAHPVYLNVLTDSFCHGSIYNWQGNDYTTPGTYYDSLQTTVGCDSVFVLHLFENPVYLFEEYDTICQNDPFNWHNHNYFNPGTYYDSLSTLYGCDSVYILHLTVNLVFEYEQTEIICQGETFSWRGDDYVDSGTYYDNLNTVNGCDSTYILYLIVNPSYEIVTNESVCDGQYYTWRGNSYNLQGTYFDYLQTGLGCDSTYVLNLTIKPTYEFVETTSVCNGQIYTWRGDDFSTPGTYYDSLQTALGCDSVFVLHLLNNSLYHYVENHDICAGEIYNWHGNDYDTTGVYYDSLQTISGCDSVYELHLTVNPTYEFVLNEAICNGESFSWHGNIYTVGGTYYDSLQTVQGCDSVYVLHLTVNPFYQFNVTETICDGDTLSWHGLNCTLPGFYYDSLLTTAGCDSVYMLNLIVKPVFKMITNHQMCDGDIFNWRGNNYSLPGTYYDSLQTIYGCDSIFVLNLSITLVDLTVTQNGATFSSSATGATYQWVDCDNNYAPIPLETNSSFTATANGNYAVIVTKNGCVDTSACFNLTNVLTGQLNGLGDINIFPNPNDGNFNIELFETAYITVYDAIGSVVYKGYFVEGTHPLHFNHLANGVYFIKAEGTNTVEIVRVAIQK